MGLNFMPKIIHFEFLRKVRCLTVQLQCQKNHGRSSITWPIKQPQFRLDIGYAS
jgi:hypothetical protein